jgi:polysaccharide deacetylase family protein (PEP-CTERM system associated)
MAHGSADKTARAAMRPGSGKANAASALCVNALSVDLEDYFHAEALAPVAPRESWDRLAPRCARATDELLAMFAQAGARATFFVLGWVARRDPALVRRIAAAGHEVASHGMEHVRVDRQDAERFRIDVASSRALLEDISGTRVAGYRAPCFSIGAGQFWAYPILAEAGYADSSSVYPVRHDAYGLPGAPRTPFRPREAPGLVELVLPTLTLAGRGLPAGGGGFFRLLPYAASRWAIARVNRAERRPCIFYMHPWEIDPGQPRIGALPARSRLRHYLNLGRTAPRLRRLLRDFRWDRIDVVHAANLAAPGALPAWSPADPATRRPGR